MSHGLIYFLLSITCVDIIVSKQQGFQVFYLLLNGTAVNSQLKIYHIVHVDRLTSIISQGCLWSDATVQNKQVDGTTIGMRAIKARRLGKRLT